MKKLLLLALLFTGFAQAQIVNILDSNFKAVLLLAGPSQQIAFQNNVAVKIDLNNDGEIQLSEAALIDKLYIDGHEINDLTGIEQFVNLKDLNCSNNYISALDLGTVNLQTLVCSSNLISDMNISASTDLTIIDCSYNFLTALDFSAFANLTIVYVYHNQLTSLTVAGLQNLQTISCDDNQLTSINLSNLPVLTIFGGENNLFTALDFSGTPLMNNIHCANNSITSLNITNLQHLGIIDFSDNQVSSLSFANNGFLWALICNNNLLTSLDISSLTGLETLKCGYNQITSLDFTGLNALKTVVCSYNNIASLDFSGNPEFITLECRGNPNLAFVNVKNGKKQVAASLIASWANNPSLAYVCADNNETAVLQSIFAAGNLTGVNLNTYCSFTPGGAFNTISGTQIFDANNNGCDASDFIQPNIKININDGTNQGASFTNGTGNYAFYTQAGNFTLTPQLESPAFFNVSPSSAVVNFAAVNNSVTAQNFCLTANGVHPDLEIVVAPVIRARPGFDAVYKIVYRNKGNQVMSQPYGISFFFDQNLLTFNTSVPAVGSSGPGTLNWNYADLQPFESRTILVTLHVNAPTDANPVNIGDVLTLTANVMPGAGDETPSDNIFVFHQTVVGSYDPNEVICIEGQNLPTSEIGKYLHYAINFENTGTDFAENIVVKATVDLTKFDLNSLQILGTSHPAIIQLTGNVLEVIFKNIYLQTGGHGNILLKVKSKSSLTPGSVVAKSADIFFDYNFPVATNTANTVYQNLGIGLIADESVGVWPNPAHDVVKVKAANSILSVQLYDIQGRLLQTRLTNDNAVDFDISDKTPGVYFLKIQTEKGAKTIKMLKN